MLGGRDETGIENVGLGLLLDELARFLDEAFHAHAFLSARAHIEVGADPLEALDMLLGHLCMARERLLELRMIRRFRHSREALDDLLLRAVQVLELFDVKVLQGFHFHSMRSAAGCVYGMQ